MAHTTFTLRAEGAWEADTLAHIREELAEIAYDNKLQLTEKTVASKLTARVFRDPRPYSPREDDGNLGVMHCRHGRYTLGDPDAVAPFYAGPLAVELPIYMLDHSGLALSHTPFSCPWDSGLLGTHYMTLAVAKDNWPETPGEETELQELVEEYLKTELRVYNNFIQGNVWGYEVVDEEDEIVDSCYGFYGERLGETQILDNCSHEHIELLIEAWKRRFEA